jgi:hypothetical protein
MGIGRLIHAIELLVSGRVQGWRRIALIMLLPVTLVAAFWAYKSPRSMANGTWEVEPGQAQLISLEMSKSADIKVECVSDDGDAYSVKLLDDANKEALMSEQPAESLGSADGTGTVTLDPVSLTEGKYWVVVVNQGEGTLSVKYRVYQMPQ